MTAVLKPFLLNQEKTQRKSFKTLGKLALFSLLFLFACAGGPPPQTDTQTSSLAGKDEDTDRASGRDRRPSGAKALGLNASVSDRCSTPEGDKTDWWYIDVPGEGKLALTLKIKSVGSDLNLIMVNRSGSVVASSRGGESVVKEFVEKDVVGGRYYARVYAVRATDKSAYELSSVYSQKGGMAIPVQDTGTTPGSISVLNRAIKPERRPVVRPRPMEERPAREVAPTQIPPREQMAMIPSTSKRPAIAPDHSKTEKLVIDQGIEVRQITPAVAVKLNITEKSGLVIVNVIQGSPAAAAGFRRGDIIVAIDEIRVYSINALSQKIKQYHNGDTILFVIKRESHMLDMLLKVSEPGSRRYS